MHTAFEVKKSMFSISIDGVPAEREDLLDWDVRDRLGVLVDRPVGALGAGLITLLAITAFYDAPAKRRRTRPLYPDIFLFHVGRRWGCFSTFDFWPEHKEIFVDADPREILSTINNRGITHLVVPERSRRPTAHRYKEPEAAIDRIKQCFLYGPNGTVKNADVSISTDSMALLGNFEGVLHPDAYINSMNDLPREKLPLRLRSESAEETAVAFAYMTKRATEIDKEHPDHKEACKRLDAARHAQCLTEQLRRTPVEEMLEMLG